MRVYRVQFEGMDSEFHHAATEEQIVELGFANALTLSGLGLDTSITLKTTGFNNGWDQYAHVTFTAHDFESYKCNCCRKEVPGDGIYDICHLCGWENDPDETLYPDTSGGPNHMSLSHGRSNYDQFGWYKERSN